jgi:hypothetical protein
MNIREFPLAWRWTDERHAVLPDAVLEQMLPCEPSVARQLFQHTLSFMGGRGLSEQGFAVSTLSTASLSKEEGCAWLRALQPILSTEALLSWQPETALRTTWEIFTSYWPTFCYPASDDLAVWPEDGQWVLLYLHDEEFQFGTRKS